MKSIIVLVIVCFAVGFPESYATKEERMEMFINMAHECATKEGASSADVDDVVAHKPASGRSGKCLRACLAETIGMLKHNCVDIEGVAQVAAMAFDGNPSKIQVAKDLANECVNITDDDRCEAAAKIIDCGQNAAKSKGLTFEDL